MLSIRRTLLFFLCTCFGAGVVQAQGSVELKAFKIESRTLISCISDERITQARVQESDDDNNSDRARSFFTQWLFGNNKNQTKSRVSFLWEPKTDKGPAIEIITNDKSHNLVSLRSRTKESLIVVSSASSPMTTESWTFSLNFNLETLVATRVQSNRSGVRGEVLSYSCTFENAEPAIDAGESANTVG